MMRKSLRRMLERLRAATGARLGEGASIRSGLQEPQRMQPLLTPARKRSS
jgi:hypothetical protein